MMGLQENILAAMALGAAWLASAAIAYLGFNRLLTMIRERHPATWEQLGKPGKMTRLSQDASATLRSMVTDGADYATEDRELSDHLAWLSKVLLVSRLLSVALVVWILALVVDI